MPNVAPRLEDCCWTGNFEPLRTIWTPLSFFSMANWLKIRRLANSLATIFLNLDPDNRRARFLVAATWDRLMWRLERPQWYATQYVKEGDLWVLWEVDDSAVSDEERHRMTGRTLAESKAFAEQLNARESPANEVLHRLHRSGASMRPKKMTPSTMAEPTSNIVEKDFSRADTAARPRRLPD